jgi:hypothetical protein
VNKRIKLIVASLILLLLATNGWIRPAVAQDSVTLDGNWWQSLSLEEQLVAVESDISAFEFGYVYGITAPALIGHPPGIGLGAKAEHLHRVAGARPTSRKALCRKGFRPRPRARRDAEGVAGFSP